MKKPMLILILLFCLSKMAEAQSPYQDAVKKLNEMVGLAVPDFEATTLTGKKISATSLKGKIVVINFWFVGCKPCEEEMPLLNQLRAHYKEQDDVIFLSFAKTDEQNVKKFLEKNPFSYQTVAAAKDIAHKFNVVAYPTQFIIDKKGFVRFTSIGGRDDIDSTLTMEIDKLL